MFVLQDPPPHGLSPAGERARGRHPDGLLCRAQPPEAAGEGGVEAQRLGHYGQPAQAAGHGGGEGEDERGSAKEVALLTTMLIVDHCPSNFCSVSIVVVAGATAHPAAVVMYI